MTHSDPTRRSSDLVGGGGELDIGDRRIRADDLGVELVELAEAALLRAFVAEGGAVRHDLQRRELLPAFREIRAADAGGEFGAERQRIPAAIREGVHLFRDDIGGLEIGSATCRARVCQYVYFSVVADILKQKKKKNTT